MATNEDNVKRYILASRKKKANDDLIKSKLLKAGFKENLIEKVFGDLKKRPSIKIINKSPVKIHPKKEFYIVLSISIIVILSFFFTMLFFNMNECSDDACFLEKANNCEAITYAKSIDTIQIQLEIEENCTLTKTITSLDESEPEEIKDIFLNKSMVCTYEKDSFPEELSNSISSGIEFCEGDLKDGILVVMSLVE